MYSLCTHRIQLQQWLCNIFVNILHDITYCQRLQNSQLFSNLCPPPCLCIFSLLPVIYFNKMTFVHFRCCFVFFLCITSKIMCSRLESHWNIKLSLWSGPSWLILWKDESWCMLISINKAVYRLMSQIWKQSDFKSYSNTTSHHVL